MSADMEFKRDVVRKALRSNGLPSDGLTDAEVDEAYREGDAIFSLAVFVGKRRAEFMEARGE